MGYDLASLFLPSEVRNPYVGSVKRPFILNEFAYSSGGYAVILSESEKSIHLVLLLLSLLPSYVFAFALSVPPRLRGEISLYPSSFA